MEDIELEREKDWATHLKRIVQDPWYFATQCVFTKDEVDFKLPVKRFPGDLEYLKLFCKTWQKERFVAVPKSRRMFMTWCCLTLHLWDAMWHRGRNIAFVSKKEDDADDLLEKCRFILKNIREEDLPSSLRPKWETKFCELRFPEIDSVIGGFPQGADQLRMHTFSRILADEMAFWEQAESMYSGAAPTLEGGGCMTAISSAAPSFFKRIVFDTVNQDAKEVASRKYFPMKGIKCWRNHNNKFLVFECHYSADPKKTPEYMEEIKNKMPLHKFLQEYEISWDTHTGKPVHPDFNRRLHGSKEEITPEFGIPLILGVDQGLKPACIVMQPQGDQMMVMRVYRAVNMGAERFVEFVKTELAKDFPEWARYDRDYIVGMDPTAFNRRDVDERTYSQAWLAAGFTKTKPGANLFEKRRAAVDGLLTKVHKGQPAILVDLVNADPVATALEGGYRFDEKHFEIEKNNARPIKDEWADIADALQYGLTAFYGSVSSVKHQVPRPSYAWTGKTKAGLDGKEKRRI